jgi:hypothetical protein
MPIDFLKHNNCTKYQISEQPASSILHSEDRGSWFLQKTWHHMSALDSSTSLRDAYQKIVKGNNSSMSVKGTQKGCETKIN